MAEQVTIDIDEQGNAKLTVSGCPGPSCRHLTKDIEKALGTVTKDAPTKELYETTKTRVVNRS